MSLHRGETWMGVTGVRIRVLNVHEGSFGVWEASMDHNLFEEHDIPVLVSQDGLTEAGFRKEEE